MPWPQFFFRARKRPDEKSRRSDAAPAKSPASTSVSVVPTSTTRALGVDSTALASTPIAPPAEPAFEKPAPEKIPPPTEDRDPLSALSRSVDAHLAKRGPLDGPILTKTTSKLGLVDTAAIAATIAENKTPADPFIFPPGAEVPDAIKLPPPGATNLRRKAKLIDLARMVAPPPEPPPAVTPPAFTVTTPPGQVLPGEAPAAPAITSPGPDLQMPSPTSDPIAKEEIPPASAAAPEPQPVFTSPLPLSVPDKKEFLLTNGERIFARVLSETDEAIYLEHGTLGVLTLPRAQIAKRPIEIILINGDRIVGDIMAETHDTIYVRHASLGMLTVPRAQRSTRVVEAILKDGDRILGEVLTETDTFTIIRSASLGTVTVPHQQVAMLNRKIEQIALKSLPALAAPTESKPTS